ncbi:LacI family transcriptional regulator [Paenibacillus baekrokdamisoli]|uniref:LacI family transcriptional regulator n=1 Tax=Paenibacillus baekrokdamisoli TaxID=1712516 RepID=A0A3G9J6L3_9BACL|nr:LacI family DNA-binding transcriptional regulator [Paenibacillus baekrokdamisoli]MBB3070410.1 DNA-binding LacI/PurR family transcriptional regulator [Paenibacillus baekrokdamisoli]BBH21411.1 LacI family transcriptional regulator [Paenibacillus baekrokdamisoli]
MVTKKEIAEHLGVSRTAVSLVLNNTPSSTISTETRNKILQAAKELGYRDIEVSPKLCYVLYDREANDPRYLVDLQIMESAASQFNYGLVFMNITHAPDSLNKLQKYLDNQEIEGFIVSGDVDETLLDLFRQSNTPYIFYGMPLRDKEEGLNFIAFDERKLAHDATEYLFSLGHTRIALFIGSLDYDIHQLALEGFRQAHEKNGIPLDKSLIQISNDENGYELCKRAGMLQLDYTAAFCANTIIQFGALQYLQSTGVSVPNDISLIGSGLTELVKVSSPQLTTYYVSAEEKAKTVSMLLEIINNRNPEGTFSSRITEFERFEGDTAAPCKKGI